MLKRIKARVIRPTTMELEELVIEVKTVKFMTDKSVFYRIGLMIGRWLRKCFDELKRKKKDYLPSGVFVGIVALWLGLIYYNETRVRISRNDYSASTSIKSCTDEKDKLFGDFCEFIVYTRDIDHTNYKKGYAVLKRASRYDLVDTNCDDIPDDVFISNAQLKFLYEFLHATASLESIKTDFLVREAHTWREYKEKLGIDEAIRDGKLSKPECR